MHEHVTGQEDAMGTAAPPLAGIFLWMPCLPPFFHSKSKPTSSLDMTPEPWHPFKTTYLSYTNLPLPPPHALTVPVKLRPPRSPHHLQHVCDGEVHVSLAGGVIELGALDDYQMCGGVHTPRKCGRRNQHLCVVGRGDQAECEGAGRCRAGCAGVLGGLGSRVHAITNITLECCGLELDSGLVHTCAPHFAHTLPHTWILHSTNRRSTSVRSVSLRPAWCRPMPNCSVWRRLASRTCMCSIQGEADKATSQK